jgi:hypothetical protein
MRRWKPIPSPRLWVGVLLLILSLAAAVALTVRIVRTLTVPADQWPIGLALFAEFLITLVIFSAVGGLVYRVGAALTLSYEIDRNGLYINWFGNRAVIPLSRIESVATGVATSGGPFGLLKTIGYYHGTVRSGSGRRIQCFSTTPIDQALIVNTLDESYALSPHNINAFVQELELRRRLGAIQSLVGGIEVGRPLIYAFWTDRVVRPAVAAAGLMHLTVLGWIAVRYADLPAEIALRRDQIGSVTELVPRSQVLFLPAAALLVIVVNLVIGMLRYRRDPLGVQVLQILSAVTQFLFAVAIISVVR